MNLFTSDDQAQRNTGRSKQAVVKGRRTAWADRLAKQALG
jgi:hypothetical protein